MTNNKEDITDFGFQKVKISEKGNLVKNVFNSVASKYDLMNDLMSGGMHRIWKRQMIKEIDFKNSVPSSLTSDYQYNILDVAGGTGDIAFAIIKKALKAAFNIKAEIADINPQMLKFGQNRAIDNNMFSFLTFTEADGENLPYNDNNFDYYTIAFGIRNFTNIEKGLKEAYRILKPNGKFICLEFSEINNLILSKIYDLYSFNIIPKIGKFITNDQNSYQYLVESIRKFPNQEKFRKMIEAVGFKNVSYQNLNFGLVAIHTAIKL